MGMLLNPNLLIFEFYTLIEAENFLPFALLARIYNPCLPGSVARIATERNKSNVYLKANPASSTKSNPRQPCPFVP
jgi:hypothetical protein